VDDDFVRGLVKEDAMATDTEAEQALELTGEGLDLAFTGFGVTVESGQNLHRGRLVDGPDLRGHVWLETNSLHAALSALESADLVHGEAALGNHLLEGNAFAAPSKIFSRGSDGAAVLFIQLIVIVVNHDLEQVDHRGNLTRRKPVEQFVRVLLVVHTTLRA
jgi:hypothetical protein